MDARIDPAKALGLAEGDAHVIRNAGGLVTDDALRSLVVSAAVLGTREVLVVGHTDCGMLGATNDELRAAVGPAADSVDFAPFDDLEETVRESVRRVRESGLLPDGFRASAWVFEVESGRIRPVEG